MHAPLADIRLMPLETAAAVYEANAADADYFSATFFGRKPLPIGPSNPMWVYREAAEAVMFRGFAAVYAARGIRRTLTAATARVRRAEVHCTPRAALEALEVIHAALTAPDRSTLSPVPLAAIHALEDTCESWGVVTGEERATCPHRRIAEDCCA